MSGAEEKLIGEVNSKEEKHHLEVLPESGELVDADSAVATTKEEEWVTKKKIELTTTKQIETRVKRQLILEDGKIVKDTGPVVTTNTTEDTEKQEHSQTEHRTLGDDDLNTKRTAISNVSDSVKEVQEKTVRSREEKEERTETEDVQHLGDISDEGYMAAIKAGKNIGRALQISNKKELVESLPKVVHRSTKVKKFIDSEDNTESSRVQPGGKIINERKTTRVHEELNDCNVSDSGSSGDEDTYAMTNKKNSQRYFKTKDQALTQYLANGQKIGEKLIYEAEASEGEKQGDEFDDNFEEAISSRLKRIKMRFQNKKGDYKNRKVDGESSPPFKRSPSLDEEETRKEETSKWLEHHFGSESTKSSRGSIEGLDDIIPSTQNTFINVTMKSQLNSSEKPRSYDGNEEVTFRSENQYFPKIDFGTNGTIENEGSESHFSIHPRVELNQKLIKWPRTRELSSRRFLSDSTDMPNANGDFPKGKSSQLVFKEVNSNGPHHRGDSWNQGLKEKENERFILPEIDRRKNIETPIQNSENMAEKERTPVHDPFVKKYYQRTRFAADIPAPSNSRQLNLKQKNKFGAGFRALMSKLISISNEKKNKKSVESNESQSSSTKGNTYLNYNSLDNDGHLMSRDEGDAGNNNYFRKEFNEPIPPTRIKRTQMWSPSRGSNESEKLVQRYYLGEDPFVDSIYGRESEYDDSTEKTKKRIPVDSEEDYFVPGPVERLSRSTTHLVNSEINLHSQDKKNFQSLQRKFRDGKMDNSIEEKPIGEGKVFRKINLQASDEPEFGVKKSTIWKPMTHAQSLINVSFVNKSQHANRGISSVRDENKTKWYGPAKPARTYITNLARSQSFNAQPSMKGLNHSNRPINELHGLQESPPPLKSPSMIYCWSQNNRNHKSGKN